MNRHHAPSAPSGFADPEHLPGALDAHSSAAILGAVSDVALVLDADGTVLDMAVSDSELARLGIGGWVGQRWSEVVMPEGLPKIAEMLSEAHAATPPRWRQLTHSTPNGDVPVKYLVMRLGASGRLIAVGRELRGAAETQQRLLQAQQSLERDYLRMRQAEARYRLLFDMAREPVLIVDAATRRIREANSAAHRLIGVKEGGLIDQPAGIIADPGDRDQLIAYLGAAEAGASLQPLAIRLRREAGNARITATLFRQARMALLLIRIDLEALPVALDGAGRLRAVIDHMPDAFVLTDDAMTVLAANPAFVDLAEVAGPDQVIGRRIGEWVGRPGIDAELIQRQLREHDLVRNVGSVVRGAQGSEEEVELSAVRFDGGGGTFHFGFSIRAVSRRLREVPFVAPHSPRSVEQLTDLVGRMPLKEIVRESTDLIERLCIEAALTYTEDNRASAAEMLGLSRQSLYSKLHRHGLGSLSGDGDVPDDN